MEIQMLQTSMEDSIFSTRKISCGMAGTKEQGGFLSALHQLQSRKEIIDVKAKKMHYKTIK